MVLEAALILPFFLAFLLLLNCLIRIAVVESKLQKAVGETAKVLAVHMEPVELLYAEAKGKWNETRPAQLLERTAEQIKDARSKVTDAEAMAERMESLLPDSILQWVEWEKERREQLEAKGQEAADGLVHRSVDPVVNRAFVPIVLHYADPGYLRSEQLTVTEVTFPDFEDHGQAFVGIEAQYDYKLPVPFMNKTLHLRKKAWERAWVGK
jgi:hypothetical protein